MWRANSFWILAWLVTGTCAEPGTTLAAWTFTYDGDGTRVKQEYTDGSGSLTTYYFFGGAYEVRSDGTTLKYYSFGGQTIMRDEEGLKYFLTDHLGSVVAVTDSTGALLSQTRYLPFGLPRSDVGAITQTDYGYTGQRDLDAQNTVYSLGLMDYKARFYSASLMRFTQPDSIIPGAGNPQAWNRYAYTLNTPVNLNDPSGNDPNTCKIVLDGECINPLPPPNPHKTPIRTSSTETFTRVLSDSLSSSPTPTPLVSQSTATPTVCLTPPPGSEPCASNNGSDQTIPIDPNEISENMVNILDFSGYTLDLMNGLGILKSNPIIGWSIDATQQLFEDILDINLSDGQRFARIALAAFEGGFAGVAALSFAAVTIIALGGPTNPIADVAAVSVFAVAYVWVDGLLEQANDKYLYPIIDNIIP